MPEGERRLAAVMFTDIVGYTAVSQRDEKHALEVLESHNDMLRPIFAKHGGNEVKTMGDSFLVEFASALAATECAIEIQQTLAEVNKDMGGSSIMVRIGVHLGDVIRRGNDIFGDAVNIASRIQPLAEPGGICVSEEVYSVIRNKIPYAIEMVPAVSLKNVELPMNVYMIASQSSATPEKGILEETKARLAVLPFSNISPDPGDAYFADGMTEELITVLSHVQDLRVIARTSVDRFSRREKGVAQIARELHVGSVVEGSVRMAGDRIRVTVQLINGKSEEHLWAENYDRRLDDIFAIQTDIAKQVAQSLKMKLLEEDKQRLVGRAAENVSAYVNYLKGRGLLSRRKSAELKQAKELFETTIAEDPKFAPGYSGLADAYLLLAEYFVFPRQVARKEAKTFALKALQLDPDLAEAHASLGAILQDEFDFAKAEEEFRKATALNPSYADAHLWFSYCLINLGKYQEALRELRLAENADPLSVVILWNEVEYFGILGRMEEAASKLRKALEIDPDHWGLKSTQGMFDYINGDYGKAISVLLDGLGSVKDPNNPFFKYMLALAYAAMGDKENARKWLRELMSIPEGTSWRNMFIAYVYAALGDADQFFTFANRAFQEKNLVFGDLRLIDRFIPGTRKIHDDPRLAELFKRVNLDLQADIA